MLCDPRILRIVLATFKGRKYMMRWLKILPLLVALGFIIIKGVNYYQTEEKNEAIDLNNALVNPLDEIVQLSDSYTNQMIAAMEATADQKRTQIELLNLLPGSMQEKIAEVRTQISLIDFEDRREQAQPMLAAATHVLDVYEAGADSFDALVARIYAGNMSEQALIDEVNIYLQNSGAAENEAIDAFAEAQAAYLAQE